MQQRARGVVAGACGGGGRDSGVAAGDAAEAPATTPSEETKRGAGHAGTRRTTVRGYSGHPAGEEVERTGHRSRARARRRAHRGRVVRDQPRRQVRDRDQA